MNGKPHLSLSLLAAGALVRGTLAILRCMGASSISGTGQFTLQPKLGQWSNFSYANFGDVFVGLPNGSSSFRGDFIAD